MAHILFDMYDGKLNPVTGIPEETTDRIYSSIIGVEKLLFYYSLVFSVMDAYHELIEWNPIHKDVVCSNYLLRDIHKADRLTRSYLFEFRTVLDHMETAIKRDFGQHSEEWNIFSSNTSNAYDQVPEYAFTYHLRNCAQHCANVVHGFNGCTGSCISSNKKQLMQDFSGWKSVDTDFMARCPDNIDLSSVFGKANAALSNALTPLIQHFLNEGDTLKQLWFLRRWGESLVVNFKRDVHSYHMLTPVLPDGSEASIEDWKSGKVESFDGNLIAWDEIYALTNNLEDENGNAYRMRSQ